MTRCCCATWVVTLPADCRREDAPAFFAAAVEFMRERYGADNVPGGFVHMDESTPHVHVPVVPVIDGKLQASKAVNRTDLQTFHRDLGRAVDAALGYHVSVELDDDQRGAKQLSRLNQKEYAAAKDELAALTSEVAELRDKRDEIARATAEESERLESLQRRAGDVAGEVDELRRAIGERQSAVDAARLVAKGVSGHDLRERESAARSRIRQLKDGLPELRIRLREARRAVGQALERLCSYDPERVQAVGIGLPRSTSMRLGKTLIERGHGMLLDSMAYGRLMGIPTRLAPKVERAWKAATCPREEYEQIAQGAAAPAKRSKNRSRGRGHSR
jgi:hypothetical protein